MRLRPLVSLLVACLATAVCLRLAAAAPDSAPGLRPDPAAHLGALPNGFRYAVRPHAVPPGRLSFALYVAVGSRHEAETELGYAHFVEHLAFAGSRDFPGDAAIRTLQRYGLGFGSEFNAATGRDYTVYEVRNVPAADPAAIAAVLKVLRNFADGLTIAPEAVERERGVIRSESSVRAGRLAYWWERELEYLAPRLDEIEDREIETLFRGTPLGRSQLGTSRSLARATAETLRAFHDRWYRPERMVLAVVGEADPAGLAARIAAEFGGVVGRGPQPAEVPVEAPRLAKGPALKVFPDPGSPAAIVTVLAAVPRPASDREAERREDLAGQIALRLLERRLASTLRVTAQIEAWVGHEVPGWSIPLVRVRTIPAQWTGVAVAVETEVRRAVQHGFSAEELKAAVAAQVRRTGWSVREAESRTSVEVALALAHTLGRGGVFAAAEAERGWLEARAAALSPEDCRAALERLWAPAAVRVVVTGPEDAEPMVAAARAGIAEARVKRHEPYRPPTVAQAQVPERAGPAGAVLASEHNAALDSWLVQFANGVRLNLKSTRFETGTVRVRVAFGHGLLGTEPGREGLAFGIAALSYGGIEGLSAEQERELLDTGGITTNFGFGADRLGLAVRCPSPSLRTALALLAARWTAPAFRPSGEAHARAFIDKELARSDRTAAVIAEDRMREHIFGGHHALTRPRRAETQRLTFDDLRRWIEPQLADSPIEIAVVGDIGLEEAVAAVAETFGKLPARTSVDPMADRRLFTPGPMPQRLEVQFMGKRTVASVALAWRIPDVVGQRDDCRMRLVASVVEDRLRVRLRQEMGKTYTPVVGVLSERALSPAMLVLRCRLETAPKQVERVAAAARAAVADLVRDGITPDELERARLPLVRQAEENTTNNHWWLMVLGEAQGKPQFAEEQGEQRRILAAATRDEVEALARLLFSPDRLCELRVTPR